MLIWPSLLVDDARWCGNLEGAIVEGRCGGMLALAMPPQVDLALEGLVAETALEGLVAVVFSHVGYQVAALGERLVADYALVWLFTWKHEQKRWTVSFECLQMWLSSFR